MHPLSHQSPISLGRDTPTTPDGSAQRDTPGAASFAVAPDTCGGFRYPATPRDRIRLRRRLLPLIPAMILATLTIGAVGCQVGDGTVERGKGESGAQGAPAEGKGESGVVGGQAGGQASLEASLPLLDRRSPAGGVGLDSLLVQEALEVAGRQSRLHNMLVARHGEVLLERHFRGPPPDRPANVKSVSKSLLSAVVGGAIQDGYLDGVEIPMAPFFQDYVPAGNGETEEATSDPRHEITLAHLLSMSSGLQSTSFGNYGSWVASRDWIRWVLERPMIHEPGDRMVYSTGNSHLVSALLVRASGLTTHELARRTLAEPAGIRLPAWPRDPQGIHFGGNDMLISPRDLLRFGELYRQGGILEGERILERSWVEESWRPRVFSRRDGNGYGLGWWARDSGGHEVRFAWGYGGQFLFIVPELELTVVFTSDPWSPREGGHNQVLHGIVDDYLVPAAVAGAAPPLPAHP